MRRLNAFMHSSRLSHLLPWYIALMVTLELFVLVTGIR